MSFCVKWRRPDFLSKLYVTVDEEVAAVRDAVAEFTELGAHVQEVAPPFENPLSIFQPYWYSGAANLLRRFSEEQRQRIGPRLAGGGCRRGFLYVAGFSRSRTVCEPNSAFA